MTAKITFFLTLLLMAPCFKSKDIKLLDATKQTIIAGRKETPSKIRYSVLIIVLKSSKKLSIESAWVGSRKFMPVIRDRQTNEIADNFVKGDTLKLLFTFIEGSNAAEETKEQKPEYSGEGVIRIRVKKKSFSREIPEFRSLPLIEER